MIEVPLPIRPGGLESVVSSLPQLGPDAAPAKNNFSRPYTCIVVDRECLIITSPREADEV